MKIILPKEIKNIITVLRSAGYEGYIVGGCVRDSILGIEPKDWDLCTSAAPNDVINIFKEIYPVIPTGIKHGTVTLVVDNKNFELTTYRVDDAYSDNRRPDCVTFTRSLTEDLARRDFTINAMAYNETDGLIDPYEGKCDLSKKIISCVGDADSRISEDYLRALRAVRFSCHLDFKIEKAVIEAIIKNKSLIKNLSMERIRDELVKILLSAKPGYGVELLYKLSLFEHIVPGINEDMFNNNMNFLNNIPPILELRLAVLFYNTGGSTFVSGSLKRLRFPNNIVSRVCLLLEGLANSPKLEEVSIKKFILKMGIENINYIFDLLLTIFRNDIHHTFKLRETYEKILSENHPLKIADLEVNGSDLLNIGYKQGRETGDILNTLLELVLEHPELNNKEVLLKIAKDRLH